MSPRDLDRAGRLTRFSLDRRITVLVLFLTILVVGAVAATGIPLELLPGGFEGARLGVYIPYRNTPAPEVMEKITLPLEEELSGIQGLQDITSYSWTNGARVSVTFKQGTDMDIAYREVRDRVERARARFPDDVERIYYRKHDASGIPVAVLGMAVDPNLVDTYNMIQNEVINRIQRIDGVASVQADGLEEKEILIELDRGKLEGAGLNIYSLAMELSGDNFTMASGNVRHGARKLLLRSVARYDDIEALENRMVTKDVRLKDIAEITYEEAEKRYRVRVNGFPAYALIVFKEGQANTMEVSKKINAMVEAVQANPRMQGSYIISLFNSGDVIEESLATLLNSGKIGGILAILVLFFFLRRFRMTAIITLSIPLSIVIGLTVMYFAGESLNILTLLGLMICVGLLVDNSVVVAENIFRMHKNGMSRREACIKGTGEITLAVVMATLTTIVVFLPVSLVEGQGQFLLLRLAIPISVSLLASLLVALVFIPLAVYLVLPSRGHDTRIPKPIVHVHEGLNRVLHKAYDLTFEGLNHGYNRLLRFFLCHRLDLSLGVVVIFVATLGLFKTERVRLSEGQDEERGNFEISVEFPRDTTLEEAGDWFRQAESILEERKEEWDLEGYFVFHASTFGEVNGWFKTPRTNDLSPRVVTEEVLDALPVRPGMQLYTGEEDEAETEVGESVFTVFLQGDDYETLERTAKEMEDFLTGIDGVLGVKKSGDREPQEVALVLDRERAQRQRVNPAVVAGVVGYALRGQALPHYRDAGKDIPVRVRFREEDRQDLSELASFLVPTETGGFLPLSSVTEAEQVPTYRWIVRRNKRVSRTITLELEEGEQEETRALLGYLVANTDLPEGITLGSDMRRRQQDEDQLAMLFAALFSIIFIYLLMGYLFESIVLPLSIILTIPLAVIGVGWIHFFFGLNIDFLGLVGGILLIGVVVNNGIVLIDYVNRLRTEGLARLDALLTAADRRFRPIMMTALTTIFGMIPLLMGNKSSIGLSYTSFGMTLIGGMTTATLLTLLVVPVFYTLFDDAREIFGAWLRRVLVWGDRRASSASAATGSGAAASSGPATPSS
ncbi:MAG: efflux RND transporter permease subunit, partial [Acidobacteriota bacterium]